MKTKGKSKESQRKTEGKPKGNHRTPEETQRKPLTNLRKETVDKPKENQRETIARPAFGSHTHVQTIFEAFAVCMLTTKNWGNLLMCCSIRSLVEVQHRSKSAKTHGSIGGPPPFFV